MFKAVGEITERGVGEHAALIMGFFPGHLGAHEIDKKTEAHREEGICP